MRKKTDHHRRLHAIWNLYRKGLTFTEIGQRMTPPISGRWAALLLQRGVQSGVYERPVRGNPPPLTEDLVRKTMAVGLSRKRCAQILKIDRKSLEERFGSVLDEIERLRFFERDARRRKLVLAQYQALAGRLGYNPSSTKVGKSLLSRILRTFGSFSAFIKEAGVTPARVKPGRKARRSASSLRPETGGRP